MRKPLYRTSLTRVLPQLLLLGLLLCSSLNGSAQVDFDQAADRGRQGVFDQYWIASGNYYRADNQGDDTMNYWWNANALESLTESYIRTRRPEYARRMKGLLYAIRDNNGGTYLNPQYDDMQWLALACAKAFEATADGEYLDVVNLLWEDILTGRSPEYQGAISWNKDCHPGCKNAISNSPAAALAAQLARITLDSVPRDYAREIHAFVKNELVDPSTGAVWDSYNPVTGELDDRDDWIFSSNLGMYIAASLELLKLTGEQVYLDDAVRTADYAVNRFTRDGVLFGNEDGQGDGGLFKGIFVRSLAQLVREFDLPGTRSADWTALIESNATALVERGTRGDGLVGPVWDRAPGDGVELDLSTELSGLMLLDAAASMDKVLLATDIAYGGISVRLGVGDYTAAALGALGLPDNSISSFRLPAGVQIEVFGGGSFDRSSFLIARSLYYVGDGANDLISSVKISNIDDDVEPDPEPKFSQRIQAEDFTYSFNVITEPTTDEGGGENVGGVRTNSSWTSYSNITVPRSGAYRIDYRVAGIRAGEIGLDLDGRSSVLGTLVTPNTGGWQNWTTVSQTVDIEAGTYSFGIFAPVDGWNLNWFEITEVDAAGAELGARTDPADGARVALFPNPVSASLTVTGLGQGATVTVLDAVGKVVLAEAPAQSAGTTELDVQRLPAGVYHLRVGGASPQVHKFVKQ